MSSLEKIMDSFEINKIVAAVLLVALLVIGIGKISNLLFNVEKPEVSGYKVEVSEEVSKKSVAQKEEKVEVEQPTATKLKQEFMKRDWITDHMQFNLMPKQEFNRTTLIGNYEWPTAEKKLNNSARSIFILKTKIKTII